MADVDDRGQLMLVGALTLAVMLVTLAVLLNAAIYTGNVATRDAGPGTGEAIEYETEATAMARSTIEALNERDGEEYDHLEQNFTDAVDAWSGMARNHSAVSLATTSVTTVSVDFGTVIRQQDSLAFTDPDGAEGWRLAENVNESRIRLNVSQDSLYVADSPSDAETNALNVIYIDGAGQHPLRFYTPDGTDDVRVGVGPTWALIGQCTVDPGADDQVIVDFDENTVGGEPCEAIGTLQDGLGDEYEIRIRNGHKATGTYAVNVNKSIGNVAIAADADGDDPTVTTVLYGATLRVTYRSPDVYYRSEFQVVAGESDA